MNGAGLRYMLGPLEPRLADVVELVYPDAPHAASEESVAGIAALMGGFRPKPPNLEWWNASEDRRTYRGWHASRERLRELATTGARVGVLGFSQGAAVAASLAASARAAEFPALAFVVLVAGFVPRDAELAPLFEPQLSVPSLHVFGERDSFARHAPALVERFAPHSRRELRWPGHHTVPASGAEADVLVEFIRAHA